MAVVEGIVVVVVVVVVDEEEIVVANVVELVVGVSVTQGLLDFAQRRVKMGFAPQGMKNHFVQP